MWPAGPILAAEQRRQHIVSWWQRAGRRRSVAPARHSAPGVAPPAGTGACTTVGGQARAAEQPLSIEALLREGWGAAGDVAVSDNRSLILFRHSAAKYLVQCSVLIDVMRNPRLVTYCSALK
jgi:hypothetical protein